MVIRAIATVVMMYTQRSIDDILSSLAYAFSPMARKKAACLRAINRNSETQRPRNTSERISMRKTMPETTAMAGDTKRSAIDLCVDTGKIADDPKRTDAVLGLLALRPF